ncbi:ABC transporter ATP-binding protein [Shouchella patagoniensis]|uniref:ABC transporter ATP-binding protein n=1 Tax=Shouchella patagoniensis TaxID=228576 RepID=UPI000994C1CC|nr:ABC transporter ATP-binding protein [Shouchella patagoniensis]
MIDAEGLIVKRGHRIVLNDLCFQVEKGQVLGILGANGSGKTTLLQAISGALTIGAGTIHIGGEKLTRLSYKQRARRVAVLSQESSVSFHSTVEEAVMLGRYAYWSGLFSRESLEDKQIVKEVMEETNISHLAKRSLMALSGGEKQRVWLARALAQQPDCLLLDEPTNHLDLAHQVALMDHVKKLVQLNKLTVVCILHDVNITSLYCDTVMMLKGGKIQNYGPTQEVMNSVQLERLYGTPFTSWREPATGFKQFSIRPTIT